MSRACFLVLLLLPIILLAVPTVRSEAVQYNIVGTTVDVSVANVKFKVLGTGCIVNLTINDELFLLYSGIRIHALTWELMTAFTSEYIMRVDIPKVEPFTNGIIVKTCAKFWKPQVYLYGTYTIYNTGVIVVNYTFVAWNTTGMHWPGIRILFPCPEFSKVTYLATMSAGNGSAVEVPYMGGDWAKGWNCIAIPSPTNPNTYLVVITLLPHPYTQSLLRDHFTWTPLSKLAPWYRRNVGMMLVVREYEPSGGWRARPGSSITWMYILYPHSEGRAFTEKLLTIGWELDNTIASLITGRIHVKMPTTRRILENLQKNISILIDKLATGDVTTASSLAESMYDKAKNLWLTESYHELVYFVLVPSAIIFGIMILVSIRTIKRTGGH